MERKISYSKKNDGTKKKQRKEKKKKRKENENEALGYPDLSSDAPATCLFFSGSLPIYRVSQLGPNPNAACCGFQSGLAQFTVQVTTSSFLLQPLPCRDIDLMSRQRLKFL